MLFNSLEFIFLFLPITWAGFVLWGRMKSRAPALVWLTLASIVFYGYWNPRHLWLLGLSILFNFCIGRLLEHPERFAGSSRRVFLTVGVTGNLLALGYFKYAAFLGRILEQVAHVHLSVREMPLPLAISFFTFTQIAYLVDSFRDPSRKYGLLDYALFVTTFPHLVAGPLVHHGQLMPQFQKASFLRVQYRNVAVGLTVFIMGLAKKVLIADQVAKYANATFGLVESGARLSFFEAWAGALTYAFQIYYDFSGYSEMAIGLGLMFNLVLPANFNSPYQALNVSDFWRRWHMSLSAWLRDYLYIPLGGNRRGKARTFLNLWITMVLGGLWHGAHFSFVIWGALHGLYLAIHRAWQTVSSAQSWRLPAPLARALTFVSVTMAWVFFRAQGWRAGLEMTESMLAISPGSRVLHANPSLDGHWLGSWGWILVLGVVAWTAPNVLDQIVPHERRREMGLPSRAPSRHGGAPLPTWRPDWRWALLAGGLAVASVLGVLYGATEFIYFQF